MNEHCRNNRLFTSTQEFRRSITGFFKNTWPLIAHATAQKINDNFQPLKSAL